MKVLSGILIFVLCFMGKVFSQGDAATLVHLSKIPPEGILLDKGWRFHAGDNPAYVQPDLDDSKWRPIDPVKDIHDLPQIQKGIGWFRLHLHIDSTVLKESLVLQIEQTGASEIYLNGKRIYTFGKVSTNQKEIETYNPLGQPVSIQFDTNPVQVLAVRYAFKKKVPYFSYGGLPNLCFAAIINKTNQAAKNLFATLPFLPDLFRIGLFVILSFLHFALYRFYQKRRANLFFSLFAFLSALSTIHFIIGFRTHDVQLKMYFLLTAIMFYNLYSLFFLKALYIVVHYKKKFIYNLLIACFLVSIPSLFWSYHSGWILAYIILPYAISIECVRVCFLAMKRKQKGAMILAVGAITYIVFYISWQIGLYLFPSSYIQNIFLNITFNLAVLSLPVATSLLLALEFAFTNRSLEARLVEVQKLSEQTVAQEQEKQQILAIQNETLERQVTGRTAELRHSLKELKETQAQLVQREKMASLGELTAGIAHEIQNPLNFVNNFSEINKELVAEMKGEMSKNNYKEVKAIAEDIEENEEKINYHGKRADAIVKSMLEHSRISKGEKQLTDINALVDEYLRLSYHGFRAKDKSFNATIETHFDESIGKIEVIPQDIGRVLLNLFNNAFYSLTAKSKQLGGSFEPVISISTEKISDKIEIRVKDNGLGISRKIVNKIFQPFFTTKPIGEGTGLGLSLSYDIIKAHGGALEVASVEGEYAEFTIVLPL